MPAAAARTTTPYLRGPAPARHAMTKAATAGQVTLPMSPRSVCPRATRRRPPRRRGRPAKTPTDAACRSRSPDHQECKERKETFRGAQAKETDGRQERAGARTRGSPSVPPGTRRDLEQRQRPEYAARSSPTCVKERRTPAPYGKRMYRRSEHPSCRKCMTQLAASVARAPAAPTRSPFPDILQVSHAPV